MKFSKKEIFLSLLVFIGFGALSAVIYANTYGSWDKGYRASKGGTIKITDLSYDKGAYGLGYKVTNTSGTDQFIATKTKAEWDSLKAHTPSGININTIRPVTIEVCNNNGEGGVASCGSITHSKKCPDGSSIRKMRAQATSGNTWPGYPNWGHKKGNSGSLDGGDYAIINGKSNRINDPISSNIFLGKSNMEAYCRGDGREHGSSGDFPCSLKIQFQCW